ncbi:MAG: helix-turn-helix domain-containing protein [Oscillospiraceae bacterium]|nr:helix-turn-helix domain-containing protein [Oscillospiraceae bacterium]
MKVAQRIRDLRNDAELNQTQIAQLLKTSQTVYSRYERNERDLPIDYLYELCKFYNVSADYILGLTDEPRKLY